MSVVSAEPGRTTAYSSDIGWRVVWQRLGMEVTFEQIGKQLQIVQPIESSNVSGTQEKLLH